MKMMKKFLIGLISVGVGTASLVGISTVAAPAAPLTRVAASTSTEQLKAPKYIFTFIGDGMSAVQMNAARIYKGVTEEGGVNLGDLVTTSFPVIGSATTQDSTSFCPDSASTATSISSGKKTHSGVIGYEADKTTKTTSISELLKAKGYKIGIVSSVSIDHATPAAFYAHEVSRSNMYNIALQLAESDFDYFAGGGLVQPTGKNNDQKDAYEIIKENGYNIVNTKEDILALNNESGKVYAINPDLQDSNAMYYNLDASSESIKLKDLVQKGIDVLDNEDGFFMMVEGGKIDWAGHANDAMANIQDVIALDEAVGVAVEFAKAHPDETLILVTGDHETGGMSIGQATTGYNTAFDILENQEMSYVAFNEELEAYKAKVDAKSANLTDVMALIQDKFGLISSSNPLANQSAYKNLVLTDYEMKKLEAAFKETMKDKEDRIAGEEATALYGGYEPLTVTLTHILNNKAGIGWTSYAHTGVPVPVYAMGQGEALFDGAYDNTDIFNKLASLCGVK